MLPHLCFALAAISAAPPSPLLSKPVLLHSPAGHTSTIRGAAFSPDGRHVATVCDGGVLNIWEVSSGKSVAKTTVNTGMGSVDYSRDGKYLVASGNNGVARTFDAKTGKELKTFTTPGQHYVARFSPDGKYVVVGGTHQTSHVFDTSSGKDVRTMSSSVTYGMDVSLDGRYVVTGGGVNTAHLFDFGTGKEVRKITGHTGIIVWISFTPDGRTFATCGYDGSIRLWETRSGKERLKITAISNSPRCNAFSGDGRFLAACAYDYTMRVFDADDGKEVFNDRSMNTSLYAVAISRDGRYLCGGGSSGKLQIWDISAATRRKAGDAEMTGATFDGHWKDLASEDGTDSYKAVVGLSAPGAMKHFSGRFAPPKPLTDEAKKKAPALIKDLEDDDKWGKASDELSSYGPAILPALKAALEKEADADVKLRLIVTIRRADITGSEELRMIRAVEVLERVGTAAAVKHLEALAKGSRGEAAALEAKAALARLKER